ncbi:MAG: glycosyltransferase family 2 protein [Candidatus Curtissbacteria bacterium]|nr:glycosyltransferase family 2 protein [Candidatus Curtissbacteria bacterium]
MKRITLTIGIPAYNEQENISSLLDSISAQKQKSYKVEKIIIVADGCTDSTEDIIKKRMKSNKLINLMVGAKREGKAKALNIIYKNSQSDLLLTIDADLIFVGNNSIEEMVKTIKRNPKTNLVGPRHVPVRPKSLMGKFAYVSYLSFEDAFLKLNNGNNFYAMMATGLIRKDFYKTFTYPEGTISDQCYLYVSATRNNKYGFKLSKNAHVMFRTVSTFEDWRILGVRSVIMDKENVAGYFGRDILSEFSIPKKLFFTSLLKWLIKSPIYTTGSILMNIYIRKFPKRELMPKNGMWELAKSSKKNIRLTKTI